MQPYFDPTRKKTSKKNGRLPRKKRHKINKSEDNLKKNKKWRRPQKRTSKINKNEEDLNKKLLKKTQPQKKNKKSTFIGCDIIVN